jgi:hypothetical protein
VDKGSNCPLRHENSSLTKEIWWEDGKPNPETKVVASELHTYKALSSQILLVMLV